MSRQLPEALERLVFPSFEGDDARAALLLHRATLFVTVLTVAVGLATALFGDAAHMSFVAHGVAVAASLGAQQMIRAGHVRSAAILFLVLLWSTITVYVLLSGGSASPIVSTYFPVTVLGAVTLGARAGFAVAALSSVAVGAMTILERYGRLPAVLFVHSTPLAWTVLAASLTMAAGLAYYAIRYLDRSLQRVRASESALRQSERRLAELVRSAPEGIVALDGEGAIVAFNPAAERIFGIDESGASGRELASMSWERPEDIRRLVTANSSDAQLRGIVGIFARGEDRRELEVAARPVTPSPGRLDSEVRWRLSVRDVTERRRAERERDALTEQLHQAQRLESLGLLAGGIAHDFNNLLTVILANAQMVAERATDGPEREMAHEIGVAGERAVGLTQQLLAFGRRQVLEPRKLVLREAVGELGAMLRRLLPESIALELDLSGDGVTRADPGKLAQVLVNLVVNARDAMPQGGTLTIQTRDLSLEEPTRGAPAGEYCALTVSDTGHGMDELTQSRVFEPFFTTKESGRGTGLGLAVVEGIVAQSDGHVHAQSCVGEGTTFHVWLPRLIGATAEAPPRSGESQPRATGTVLLAEDEEHVRKVVRRILDHAGFEVLVAVDGESALEVARAHAGPIDVLLTDVVMPRLGGVELAQKLRRERPSVNVVFMSGYAADALGTEASLGEGEHFLAKPFQPRELVELLGRLPIASRLGQ